MRDIQFDPTQKEVKPFDLNSLGKHKVFDETYIYYTSRMPIAQVDQLGYALVKSKFTDGTRKDIQIDRRGEIYVFKMVFSSQLTFTEQWRMNFMAFASNLSKTVFNNHPIEIQLTDLFFNTIHTVFFDPKQ